MTSYRLSKTGLNGLTRYLDGEYGDLLVNAVCPGEAQTEMADGTALRTAEEG